MCMMIPRGPIPDCPQHPNRMMRMCSTCVVETLKNLPNEQWLTDYLKREHDITLDPNTIQVVLDVLDQKLGIF